MVLQILDLLFGEMFCLEDTTETPRRNHSIWQRSTEDQLTGIGEAYEPFVKQMINVRGKQQAIVTVELFSAVTL